MSKKQANNSKKINDKAPPFRKEFLHPQYWKIWFLILLCALVSLLPYCLIHWLGKQAGAIFKHSDLKVIRRRRAIARKNLEMAFASRGQQWQEEVFEQYCTNVGHGLFDVVIAWFWPTWRFKKLVKMPEGAFEQYYHNDHYVFLVPHNMNLESIARSIGIVQPSYGVYLANSNKLWDWFQYRMRLKNNKALVRKDDFRTMVSTLKLKEGMFYSMDQDLGGPALYVPFFEQEETFTTKGTFMLYRLFNDLKLVPCLVLPSKDPNYKFEFKVLEALDFPEGSTDVEVVTLTNQLLEKMINLDLPNYMWFHRRFKHQKDGSYVYHEADR